MPTPAEEQAFLPSILASPGDDAARLIYADFLDESEEPGDRARAELIRVQCALARLGRVHPRRSELVRRESELLQQFQSVWAEPLRGLALGTEIRRGLLDAVSVDTLTFLTRGPELFHRAPIRRVRLLDAAAHLETLIHCPTLARVRELDLCGNDLGNGGVNLLLRSPHLRQLESLDLSFNGLCDGALRLLAGSRALPRLQSLALTDNGSIGGAGVRFLAEAPNWGQLRTLDLAGNAIDEGGVRALVQSRYLTRLHTVRVHGNPIGDVGVAELAGSSLLVRMLTRNPHLDLRACALTAVGVEALAQSPHLGRVTSLELSGNFLGDVAVRGLAASPYLTHLKWLSLRQNQIGDPGAQTLANSGLMERLAFLDVSGNRLTSKGIDALWARRGTFQTVLETSGNFATEGSRFDPTVSGSAPHTLQEEIGQVLRRLAPLALANARPSPIG